MDPQQPPAYQPPSPYPSQPPAPGQQFAGSIPPSPYQPTSPFVRAAPSAVPPAARPSATALSPTPQAPNLAGQVVQQLNGANSVLVTVSKNPSVDQLSAAVGLTLILNKLGKHATAVFSGTTPPAIEFLQPEKTLQKDTDSLRDFIIALDKAKADKLRYKIEDKFVKIFITPYRTSIDQKDLRFSQGELNVDVVVALGVKTQGDLDQAISAHGQILHDATIIGINHQPGSNLGTINWNETRTSSLCELIAKLADMLQTDQTKRLVDKQVATALLTGVMAETDRFSNSRTTPETMNMAAKLMDSGANQPLIASKLTKPKPTPPPVPNPAILGAPRTPTLTPPPTAIKLPTPVKPSTPPGSMIDSDGSLHISHDDDKIDDSKSDVDSEDDDDGDIEKIHIDEHGVLQKLEGDAAPASTPPSDLPRPDTAPVPISVEAAPVVATTSLPPVSIPEPVRTVATNDMGNETLTDIEKAVHSPHIDGTPTSQPPPGPAAIAGSGAVFDDPTSPSLPPIVGVTSAGSLEPPGSENVNSASSSDVPLFSPSGSDSAAGAAPMSPPPVPPPITTSGAQTASPDNLTDPGSGVPL